MEDPLFCCFAAAFWALNCCVPLPFTGVMHCLILPAVSCQNIARLMRRQLGTYNSITRLFMSKRPPLSGWSEYYLDLKFHEPPKSFKSIISPCVLVNQICFDTLQNICLADFKKAQHEWCNCAFQRWATKLAPNPKQERGMSWQHETQISGRGTTRTPGKFRPPSIHSPIQQLHGISGVDFPRSHWRVEQPPRCGALWSFKMWGVLDYHMVDTLPMK